MLVLMRRVDEKIIMTTKSGEKIILQVTKISGGQVSIGFDAPKSVIIKREEISEDFRKKL